MVTKINSILLALLLVFPQSVEASHQWCNLRGVIIRNLETMFHEYQVEWLVLSNGHLLELFLNKKAGTWTILETSPEGLSCIVRTGVGKPGSLRRKPEMKG